jgi:hypothetical protein
MAIRFSPLGQPQITATLVRHIDQAAQPKSGPDEKAIKCKRDNDGNKGGRYNNRRHKPLAHSSSSYNGGPAGGSSVISLPRSRDQ